MKIRLPYGKDYKQIEINDQRVSAVLRSYGHEVVPEKSQEDLVLHALKNPVNSETLNMLAIKSHRILVITSDHTRPLPSKITMPLILREIESGNPTAEIKILIATGCHREITPKEMIEKFGKEVVEGYEILCHDSNNKDMMVYKGMLPSCGELWLNGLVDWADLIIAEGFIEPHFFAGYSGGRKSILPGIASTNTVLFNHCAEFIDNIYSKTGNLKNNPIHKDMVFAARTAGLKFILNVALNGKKQIIKAFAGDAIDAHEAGCAYLEEISGVKKAKADIVVTCNGGYPLDQNIYQSVKGMTAAEACANDGGVIIILSKCEDGHGGEEFFNWFASGKSPNEVTQIIKSIPKEETSPDQWQAQILARVLEKNTVIMMSDKKQKSNIEKMHMLYARTFDEAMEKAEKIVGKTAPIVIIPDGVAVIIK